MPGQEGRVSPHAGQARRTPRRPAYVLLTGGDGGDVSGSPHRAASTGAPQSQQRGRGEGDRNRPGPRRCHGTAPHVVTLRFGRGCEGIGVPYPLPPPARGGPRRFPAALLPQRGAGGTEVPSLGVTRWGPRTSGTPGAAAKPGGGTEVAGADPPPTAGRFPQGPPRR